MRGLWWFGWMAGCPVSHRVLVRPEGELRAVDPGGAPVAARWTVRRYRVGPPPQFEAERWEFDAPTGVVAVTRLVGRETSLLLMLHGTDQWGWEVCAHAEGWAPASAHWTTAHPGQSIDAVAGSVPVVTLPLTAGSDGPCPWGDRPPLDGSSSGELGPQ